jgi:hypothetical protein
MNKPLCPCCSQRLLRHISFKRSYWFCTQCHQEMPDLNNLLKTELPISHWVSNKITEYQHLTEEWQTRKKLYPGIRAIKAIKELEHLAFSETLSEVGQERPSHQPQLT